MENSNQNNASENLQEGIIKRVFEAKSGETKIVEYFILNEYGQYIPVINPEGLDNRWRYAVAKYKYVEKKVGNLILMCAEVVEKIEPYKAVLIGIDNYASSPLRGCVTGMENLFEVLKNNYPNKPIKKIANEFAQKYSILSYLKHLIHHATENDHLLFYFSGHGNDIGEDGTLVGICAYDSNIIQEEELYTLVNNLKKGKLTIVLDSCYSGGLPNPEHFGGNNDTEKARDQMVWLLGCAKGKFSMTFPFPDGYSSIFTNYFINGLGRNNPRSLNDLFKDVEEEVTALNIGQEPTLIGNAKIKKRPFLS